MTSPFETHNRADSVAYALSAYVVAVPLRESNDRGLQSVDVGPWPSWAAGKSTFVTHKPVTVAACSAPAGEKERAGKRLHAVER